MGQRRAPGEPGDHDGERRQPIGQRRPLAFDFRVGDEGHPDIGPFAKEDAAKRRRRDADDRHHVGIDDCHAADNVRRFGEALAPEAMADDRDQAGGVEPSFLFAERSSFDQPDPERVEVVGRDGTALDGIAAVMRGEDESAKIEGQHRRQRSAGRGDVNVIRIRAARVFLAIGDPAEGDQAAGGHAGRGLAEDAVDHGVNGGVPADDEGDQDDGGRAERGCPPQDAGTNLQVGRELLERGPGPHRTRGLSGQRRAAKLGDRAAPRLGRRLAAIDAIAGRHLEMRLDLLVDFSVASAPPRHHGSPMETVKSQSFRARGCMSACTASTSCFQRDCSRVR